MRYIRWAIELSEFDLSFQVRTSYKGQVLADFLAELTETPSPVAAICEIWTDGSVASTGAGVGLKIVGPGKQSHHSIRLAFPATNNTAEYEALLYGLRVARSEGARRVRIHTDSLLVTQQVNNVFQAKEMLMQLYVSEVTARFADFDTVEVVHVP